MNFDFLRGSRPLRFLAPEHGGDTISGGGHPADAPLPVREPINDTFAQDQRGYGNTPGVGVPGTHTNPMPSQEDISQLARKYWEDEGRPDGKADEHWIRAEHELRQRAGLGISTPQERQ